MPELEPLELPEPMLPLELPLEPVLGDVGLGDVVLGEVLLPVAPVPAPEPDLLKWASHSEREIWPSLLVSTAEKLGAELDAPAAALPPADDPLDMPDEPLELAPPAAEGDEVDLSLLDEPDELCASATLDNANSAAAVATLNTLSFNIG